MNESDQIEAIILVVESWEEARKIPSFEDVVGANLLKHLFSLEPRAKEIYGISGKGEQNLKSLRINGALVHAKRLLEFIDSALTITGPPTVLFRMLQDVGRRHLSYGVKPSYVEYMGQAVILSMKDWLGRKRWSDELQEAWESVFNIISAQVVLGMAGAKMSEGMK